MYCYKCGKQIPDDSTFCSYCGISIPGRNAQNSETFRLLIDRKSQIYLINPPVKVTIDGKTFLSVENGQIEETAVSSGLHTVELKMGFRSKRLHVDVKKDTVIKIGFSRATGAITATVI